jgi:hypothetical protein
LDHGQEILGLHGGSPAFQRLESLDIGLYSLIVDSVTSTEVWKIINFIKKIKKNTFGDKINE